MSNAFRCVVTGLLAASPSLLTAQQKPASGTAPSATALIVRVDSVVKADLLSRGVASVSVAVARGDEMLVQRAWGKAVVASGRAADASTLFSLGSNSKQF